MDADLNTTVQVQELRKRKFRNPTANKAYPNR